MKFTIIRKKFALVLFLLAGISLSSCNNSGVFLSDSDLNTDAVPRMEFINSVSSMYKNVGLTDHFPVSWQKTNLRTENWNASYFPSSEDTNCFCYRCMACFIDEFSDKYIDSLINGIKYVYRTRFYNDSILRFNPVYIKHPTYSIPIYYDTVHIPFYDFSEAVFNNNTMEDSIFFDNRFWYGEHQVAPLDLIVYVIDAKTGNYWKNSNNAEREDRSILPQKFKHGFSRGIAVSKSCNKVCWWAMAW